MESKASAINLTFSDSSRREIFLVSGRDEINDDRGEGFEVISFSKLIDFINIINGLTSGYNRVDVGVSGSIT